MYGHSCYSYGTWRSNKVGRGRCESHIGVGGEGGQAPRGDKFLSGESTPLDATYLLKWKDRVKPDNLT